MKIRFLFRILGTTFVIGLITIGIYALVFNLIGTENLKAEGI